MDASPVEAWDAIPRVSRIGDILVKYPQDRIRIEGHTDSRGTAAYNEELSLRRAEAVSRVLAAAAWALADNARSWRPPDLPSTPLPGWRP